MLKGWYQMTSKQIKTRLEKACFSVWGSPSWIQVGQGSAWDSRTPTVDMVLEELPELEDDETVSLRQKGSTVIIHIHGYIGL